jgi:hypothetical protein
MATPAKSVPKMHALQVAINSKTTSADLRQALKAFVVVTKVKSTAAYIEAFPKETDGSTSWWAYCIGYIRNDEDMNAFTTFMSSDEANLYGDTLKFLIADSSLKAYQALWNAKTASKDAILMFFASLCHLLYSVSIGSKNWLKPMVDTIVQITGDKDIIKGDREAGWAAGSTVEGGKIVLGK